MKLTLDQKHSIINYFKNRPEVAGVYLYGSQIQNESGPLSDVDIAVLMSNKIPRDSYFDFQLKYINNIQSMLTMDLAADVKILNDDQALIYQTAVIGNGELIVNNFLKEVEAFVHRIGMLYPDFYPVLKNYYSDMHQRLEEGTYAT